MFLAMGVNKINTYVFLLLVLITEIISFGSKRSLQVINYHQCKEHQDTDIILSKFKKRSFSKDNTTIEFEFNVKKEIPKKFHGVINLYKCDLDGNPDSCEVYVKDLKVMDLCDKMTAEGQSWSKFVTSFTPALSCPLKANKYFFTQSVDSDSAFKYYPVPSGTYKVNGQIFATETSKLLGCIEFIYKAIVIKKM